jgi:hypothetical protein
MPAIVAARTTHERSWRAVNATRPKRAEPIAVAVTAVAAPVSNQLSEKLTAGSSPMAKAITRAAVPTAASAAKPVAQVSGHPKRWPYASTSGLGCSYQAGAHFSQIGLASDTSRPNA